MSVASFALASMAVVAALGCSSGSAPESYASIEVHLFVTGEPSDTTPHHVTVMAGKQSLSTASVPYSGGTTRISGLAAGSHTIEVESPEATCWVTSRNPLAVAVVSGEHAQASFDLACFGPPVQVYNRVGQAPRDYSDRFVVDPGGAFRYQVRGTSAAATFSDVSGSWSRSGSEYLLRFSLDEWATGFLRGDCLSIRFSERLSLSDYEDGEFCRN